MKKSQNIIKMIVVNQQLQCAYWPISQELKPTMNFDQLMACQKIFLKIHTWNAEEKLFPNPSIEKQD